MVVTRFAPSPTGNLHIGGLRTALYCYLHARKNNGKFLLRIEDTDKERNSKDALDSILDSFKWTKLEYDEPLLFQSKRGEIYKKYIQQLLDNDLAYYCYLTKEELESNRQNNHNDNNFTRKYRDFKGEAPKDITPSIRIKAPLSGYVEIKDELKGIIKIDSKDLDDFIICRNDGTPTYNFVVAIDDALCQITDVIRGEDHLSNTPKQVIIYNALNFKIPKFYHIPMICNESGKKLSKRDGALSVLEYRENGYLKEALLNFLFRLGFSYKDQEIFSLEEMLNCFDASKINSKPSCANFSKLEWLNVEHLKLKTLDELLELLNLKELENMPRAQLRVLIDEILQRIKNLVEFKKEILHVLNRPYIFIDSANLDEEKSHFHKNLFDKIQTSSLDLLRDFYEHFKNLNNVIFEDKDSIKLHLNNFIESKNIKLSALMPHLRLGILGIKGGIDMISCMFILGKNETLERIKIFLNLKNNIKN